MLTSTDVGLPLGPVGTAALLPLSIAEFGSGLNLPEDQVRLYLAAREAAHHRLYAGAPWLRDRVIALISDYARRHLGRLLGRRAAGVLHRPVNDPASIEAALGQGMFEPTITPGQQAAMAELETLLALVEGWVDTVVAEAVGDRLPGAPALRETLRRRRATGGPAEQTFATLIGLELRPRRLRAAADLWREIGAVPRHRRPGRAVGAPGSAADRQGPGRSGRFRRPGQAVRRAAGRPGRRRDRAARRRRTDAAAATTRRPDDSDDKDETGRDGPAPGRSDRDGAASNRGRVRPRWTGSTG